MAETDGDWEKREREFKRGDDYTRNLLFMAPIAVGLLTGVGLL
jgi:hypothetical protein